MSELKELLREAKLLAKRFRVLTGKPLGITGEIAEFHAAEELGLELAAARQPGYDALRIENGKAVRIQIKGRCIFPGSNPGQRLGKIRLDTEWDKILLVLMDSDLEPIDMYEADRSCVEEALLAPGSKSRNERGALGVNKFKAISKKVWSRNCA